MYYEIDDVSQNTAFDSNTKTVLPSKQCFSKKYQHGIPFKANVSNVISSKLFFKVLLNWRLSVKTHFLTVIPTRYYYQKQCFSKKYGCFQSHAFKIVFQSNIALAESFKTLPLAVIPKRYYCQKLCFSKKYSNGSTFKSNVFKVIVSKLFSKVILHWRCLSKHCFWQ